MTVLDDVISMRNQGVSDSDISYTLQQNGVSPKEIVDAMNQAQIKMAVSSENQYEQEEQPPEENYSQGAPQKEMYPMQQEYGSENYSQQPIDSDATMEVAEQVFEEKIKSVKKDLDKFNEFKNLTQSKIENVSDRLKRIEEIIDKLQISILEKVGSYGSDLSSIKSEMEMMQDSFSKVVNPLLDRTERTIERKSSEKVKEPNLEDLTTKKTFSKNKFE
jgi:hypothetical protein